MAGSPFAAIPMPDSPGNAFIKGLEMGNTLLNSMMNRKLTQAQALRQQKMADLPFAGANVPGPAGQIAGLEMIKKVYGENSPQYQQAQNAFNMGQQSTQSRINYQNILSNTANKRFSTPLAKTAQEFEDVKNGYLPGTKTPLSDEQREQYKNMYGLDLIKRTTDLDTRKKNLYAHNMDITLNSIDPKALTQYSGVEGGIKLIAEKKNSLAGKTSPEYKAYEENLTRAKTLAKQVRQFYGDSITPSVQEGLKELTNPSSWLKHPDVALNNFNQFSQLLRSEAKTYQQAGQSPAIYSGQTGTSGTAQGGDDLDRMAEEAIRNGADPKAVQERMAKIRGGQ